MRQLLGIVVLAGLMSACGEASQPMQSEVDATARAFVGVNVVPMAEETVLSNYTVITAQGRIQAVGPRSGVQVPEGVPVVDGSGLYLAPGLADMHAHPMTQYDMDAYLVSGVTLIRAMWGEPAVLELRAKVKNGDIPGPRIHAGSRIVDGTPVIHYGTERVVAPEDAERVVAHYQDQGYDFIKVYSNLSLEAFDALSAAAKRHGIPLEGHIPDEVPTEHAFEHMRAAEHLTGIGKASLVDGAEHLPRWAPVFAAFATSLGTGEAKLDNHYDGTKLKQIAQAAREANFWSIPTLITIRGTGLSPEKVAFETQREAFQYTDYAVRTFWQLGGLFKQGWTEATYRGSDILLEHEMAQVKALHDAGAGLLLGTDSQNPWAFLVSGVVDELGLFVDAGLTPFQAIQTGTTAAAAYMGEEGTAGIVATGARSDLVLLRNNPLDDVNAYREIVGVMAGDQWLDRPALDGLLAGLFKRSQSNEAVFADAPEWELNSGEFAPISAEFVIKQGGEQIGKERIAMAWQGPAPVAAVGLVQEEGGYGQVRVDLRDDQPLKLTGSSVDLLSLGAQFSAMADGDSISLEAEIPGDDGMPRTVQIDAVRNPAEVLVGYFYFTGSNRYDVTIRDGENKTEAQVWMGGGFYNGWPVKVLVQPGTEDEIELARIL